MNRALVSLTFWVLAAIAASGIWHYRLRGFFLFLCARRLRRTRCCCRFLVGVPFSGSATIAFLLAYSGLNHRPAPRPCYRGLGLFAVSVSDLRRIVSRKAEICVILSGGNCVGLRARYLAPFLGVAHLALIEFSQMRNTLAAVVAVLPMSDGRAGRHYVPNDVIHEMRRSVYIEASPDVIWRNILSPTNIRRDELDGGLAYTDRTSVSDRGQDDGSVGRRYSQIAMGAWRCVRRGNHHA